MKSNASNKKPITKNIKIAEDVDSAIRYGLHEYFLLSESELSNDYEDPLIFCRKHMAGITLMIDRIFNRIANETTRMLVGEVINFIPDKNAAICILFRVNI